MTGSRPVRARGLKLNIWIVFSSEKYHVAPRAGAWLETRLDVDEKNTVAVAPRAGAWLETIDRKGAHTLHGCRAPCGRVA